MTGWSAAFESEYLVPLLTRFRRVAKELLGYPPSPLPSPVRPGNYEEQLYARLLQPGDICFDIGANCGDVAVFLARVVSPVGRVFSFEPVWPMYQQLCINVQRDTHAKAPVITLPVGLAEESKNALIHVPNNDFALGSLRPLSLGDPAGPEAHTPYPCQFTTLDVLLIDGRYPPPDFAKIDVEGAELLVLRGGRDVFARGLRPLFLIEVFAPWEQAFGYRPWAVLSLLQDLGYHFLFACPEGLVEHRPTESTPYPARYSAGYNVVAFVPERHADRVARLSGLREGGGERLLRMDPPPFPNVIAADALLASVGSN